MKKIARKHGARARAEAAAASGTPMKRLTTQVTFQSSAQCYLWTTDRGRSRLIKH